MTFPLSVYSLDRTIFEGKAVALTAPAADGEIQILGQHTPLVSALKEGDMVIEKEDGSRQKIPIAGGVVEVTSQTVIALVNF
ncbi:MAG: hypothetical protein HYS52_00490 [Candidatus Wildermuthbacteria bacterium]|nr:hypothetical protein [Candidatus Wildermuthbacteria bacterium]